MKKNTLSLCAYFLLIGLLGLLTGCVSGNWESVKYITPSNRSLPETKPKVKIVSTINEKSKVSNKILSELKKNITDSKQMVIVETDPQFIIAVNTLHEYKTDGKEAEKFNTMYFVDRKVRKNSKGKESGGHEVIAKQDQKSSAAIVTSCIVLYDVKNLEPLGYFTVSTYDSQLIPSKKKIRTEDKFYEKLSNQILKKLSQTFVPSSRQIKTYIPGNAPKKAQEYLLAGNQKDLRDFVKGNILTLDLSKIKKNIDDGLYVEKKRKEEVLTLLYLYLLSCETNDMSKENLKKLYQEYIDILKLTENEALVIGCANSIGRVENKWNLISKAKIDK